MIYLTATDGGVASLLDYHPRISVTKDIAIFYCPLAISPDQDATLLPIVDFAAADGGVAPLTDLYLR
nr:hypothetical protein [[Phormidium] sp. ETS-05]